MRSIRFLHMVGATLAMLAFAAVACVTPGAQTAAQTTVQAVSTAIPGQARTQTSLPNGQAMTSAATPNTQGGRLTKHEVKDAVARQAVCNDDSPAVYYYRPGSGADAARWLIWFQGGGYCASDQACIRRWNTQHYLMTSQGASDTVDVAGIFSTSEQQNPDFAHFTQVYIRYCSSDIYSGDGERQIGGMHMQFRGHKIVAAILADLQDTSVIASPNLKNASEVLVTGSSAGSFGAASNLDWIASQLPSAKVKGVLDSSWVAPLADYGSGPLEPPPGTADFYSYIQGVSDQSCAAAQSSQPQVCLSTLALYPYLTTPTFIYADQRDPTLVQLKGITNPSDPTQAAYMAKYAVSLRDSLKNVKAVLSPAVGIHTALTNDGFFTIKVNGHNLAELLGNWYFGRAGPVRVIDGETP